MDNDQHIYLKVRQVAAEFGVSERTVRYWIASDLLPVIRFSARTLRVRRSDLERLVRSLRS